MNKKIIITIALVSVFVLSLIGYLVFLTFTDAPTKDENGRGEIRTNEKVGIQVGNQTIAVNDFFSHPVRVLDDQTLYIADQADYGITYWPDEKSFHVFVFTEPVTETSKKAEQQFLKLLGVTESEACILDPTISGPNSLDEFADDKAYSFSFCETANKLK